MGRNGFVLADRRRQNSGTSPAGTFAVVSAFGNGPDPGTALGYREVDRNDWWTYDPRDPKTYNVLQPRRAATSAWRTSWAEDLSGYGTQYRYAAVLGFNLPAGVHRAPDGQWVADQPADTRLGGGIFLHVSGPGRDGGLRVRAPDGDAPDPAVAGPGRGPAAGDGSPVGAQPAVAGSSGRRPAPAQSLPSASLPRSCSTALVCIWQMRLSVTPRTWPISASVRPS